MSQQNFNISHQMVTEAIGRDLPMGRHFMVLDRKYPLNRVINELQSTFHETAHALPFPLDISGQDALLRAMRTDCGGLAQMALSMLITMVEYNQVAEHVKQRPILWQQLQLVSRSIEDTTALRSKHLSSQGSVATSVAIHACLDLRKFVLVRNENDCSSCAGCDEPLGHYDKFSDATAALDEYKHGE